MENLIKSYLEKNKFQCNAKRNNENNAFKQFSPKSPFSQNPKVFTEIKNISHQPKRTNSTKKQEKIVSCTNLRKSVDKFSSNTRNSSKNKSKEKENINTLEQQPKKNPSKRKDIGLASSLNEKQFKFITNKDLSLQKNKRNINALEKRGDLKNSHILNFKKKNYQNINYTKETSEENDNSQIFKNLPFVSTIKNNNLKRFATKENETLEDEKIKINNFFTQESENIFKKKDGRSNEEKIKIIYEENNINFEEKVEFECTEKIDNLEKIKNIENSEATIDITDKNAENIENVENIENIENIGNSDVLINKTDKNNKSDDKKIESHENNNIKINNVNSKLNKKIKENQKAIDEKSSQKSQQEKALVKKNSFKKKNSKENLNQQIEINNKSKLRNKPSIEYKNTKTYTKKDSFEKENLVATSLELVRKNENTIKMIENSINSTKINKFDNSNYQLERNYKIINSNNNEEKNKKTNVLMAFTTKAYSKIAANQRKTKDSEKVLKKFSVLTDLSKSDAELFKNYAKTTTNNEISNKKFDFIKPENPKKSSEKRIFSEEEEQPSPIPTKCTKLIINYLKGLKNFQVLELKKKKN